jgi:hypothetical protein
MKIESFECNGFLFQFPLFVADRDGKGEPLMVGKKKVAFFTDADLAVRGAKAVPGTKGIFARPIPGILAFLGFLVFLEHKGFTHVAIDPPGKRTFSIAALRTAIFATLEE